MKLCVWLRVGGLPKPVSWFCCKRVFLSFRFPLFSPFFDLFISNLHLRLSCRSSQGEDCPNLAWDHLCVASAAAQSDEPRH